MALPRLPELEAQVELDDAARAAVLAARLGAGAEVRLWRGLCATGEYKFTRNAGRRSRDPEDFRIRHSSSA